MIGGRDDGPIRAEQRAISSKRASPAPGWVAHFGATRSDCAEHRHEMNLAGFCQQPACRTGTATRPKEKGAARCPRTSRARNHLRHCLMRSWGAPRPQRKASSDRSRHLTEKPCQETIDRESELAPTKRAKTAARQSPPASVPFPDYNLHRHATMAEEHHPGILHKLLPPASCGAFHRAHRAT